MKYLCGALVCLLLAVSVSAELPDRSELEARLAENPDDRAALYNLGLVLYLDGEPKEAIAPWSHLRELEPNDWQVITKLIQAYTACGESHKKVREQTISELYELRKSEEIPELTKAKFFIRDQIVYEDNRIYVFEYYDMDAGWRLGPLLWKFYITEENEPTGQLITVGSYDTTTALAIEQGRIEEDERIYHLDEYLDDGGHRTYGFFINKPDYDQIKATTLEILKGEKEPLSSFDPSTKTITIDPSEEKEEAE